MKCMFYKCTSLVSLPDISKWEIENVINMDDMFNGCYNLMNIYPKFN